MMRELSDINSKQIVKDIREKLINIVDASEKRDKELKSMSGVQIKHGIQKLTNDVKSGLMKNDIPLGHLNHVLDQSGFTELCNTQPIIVLQAGPATWINQLVMWNKMETLPVEKASITIEINR